ncbi:ribokinase [Celerinatantimonas yamalensis]|uniref:Ribokinase n=1 Tax=Celerinatantimonas yamalensis TaxID=559956 RepID=A0ABW9G257_9GAMM
MKQLVVLGSVNADHVLHVEDFPKPGETCHGHHYQIVAGGKGANQAVAAARLGGKVSFIACVGDDAIGQQMVTQFVQDGIDTSMVMIQPNQATGLAMIQVSKSGENSICIAAEANAQLTAEKVTQYLPAIADADALLMQLETPLDGILSAAKAAQKAGTQVILNPAPAQPLSDELLALVDMITPNETEALQLTGVHVVDKASAEQAASILHAKGVHTVIITMGRKGAWVSEQGQGYLSQGFVVKAVDTTAAGDTFNGALITELLNDQTLEQALRFAHGAAALSVTCFGAQSSIPSRAQVSEFLTESSC